MNASMAKLYKRNYFLWHKEEIPIDWFIMALDTEGHISERYWRRYTDVKEAVGATY
jgi:hypothetical protein